MSDPPGEEDKGTLGYDELAWLDVPDSHHPAPLAWQEGLAVHLLTERKPRISADPPLSVQSNKLSLSSLTDFSEISGHDIVYDI